MPTITRQASVSYKGIEATEIFFEPVFKDIIELGFFKILPNIVNKKKMQYVGQLEKIVQKKTGCGFHPSGKLGIYDRTIEVDEITIMLEECFDEFKDTIMQEKLLKGNLKMNLSPTEMMRILIEKVRDGAMLDYIRLFWFGDKSSLDAAYNVTDGLWSVHIPQLVAANQIPYTNTNSGAPLTPGDGEDFLREVYDEAPLALKGLPNNEKIFFVSGSVYEQYREDLENSGGGDAGRQLVIDGSAELAYRGIRVVPNWNWDRYTANDLNQVDQHQILYTTPSNLIIATDLLSSLSQISVFYDELEEKTYVKVNGKLGTNYVHPSLMSVGY
jgi:hypothetical protein